MNTLSQSSKLFNEAMVAIYNDTQNGDIEIALRGTQCRTLLPKDKSALAQAMQNSAIVFIGVSPNIQQDIFSFIAATESHSSTLCAVVLDESSYDHMQILSYGFSYCLKQSDLYSDFFIKFLDRTLKIGSKYLHEEFLHNERLRLEDTISFSPHATLIFDNEKRIVFATNHYASKYPKSSEIFKKGLNVFDAFEVMSREDGIYEDNIDYKRLQSLWLNLQGQEEFTFPNGKSYRIQATALHDARGFIVTTTDISDHMSSHSQLQKKSKDLESALAKEKKSSTIQKQFIDMVSHEFKTPMTIIDGNAQIIERRLNEAEPDQIIRRAKTIQSAVKRLTSMVDGILSSSMLETGSMNVSPQEFDIRTMIKGLIIDHTSFSENLSLKYNLDHLPDLVFLDPRLMTLILTNLLSNAVKFAGEEPKIRVETQCDDINFSISVIDNGIGIPEGEHAQIFDRYYRAKNTSGVAGTGIGLSLTKELVEKQNGIMTVKNNESGGACFTITFPNSFNTKQRVGFL